MSVIDKITNKLKPKRQENKYSYLNKVVCRLPGTDVDIIVADIVTGCLLTGSTGSGKSSGAALFLALAYLRAGFGFLVLAAKPGEREIWEEYAKRMGREDDLIIFNEDSPYQFNFIEYELKRLGKGGGNLDNVIETFIAINEQNSIKLRLSISSIKLTSTYEEDSFPRFSNVRVKLTISPDVIILSVP